MAFLEFKNTFKEYLVFSVKEIDKQFGLKKPRFFHHQNAFIIQFNKKENVTNNVTNNVTDNVTGNVTDNRLLKLIELINADNQITTTELAEKTAVTKRTILRDIEKLKEQKKIIRIGSEKSGRWKVL
jgi:ATP-dependent DNA helicase RecG